jgi:solute carrier family 25 folate transporter 32
MAGIFGGAVSTLMLHPLDLMKTRFAVNDGRTNTTPRYNNLRNAFAEIIKTEGFRGLYKGVMPNIVCSSSSWGCYFFFYNTIKNFILDGNLTKPLEPSMHIFAAANAGVLTLFMTNPIMVVKTRFCLQYTNNVNTKKYRGIADALMKIYKTEGIRGLYKGLIPGFFGVSHGVLQFVMYEEMKKNYYNYLNVSIDTKLSSSEYMCFAVVSKLFASVTTYPYQVIKTRLQDHHHNYSGTWNCIQITLKLEGIKGFYKGLSPYLLHVTPNVCLVYLVYEHFINKK